MVLIGNSTFIFHSYWGQNVILFEFQIKDFLTDISDKSALSEFWYRYMPANIIIRLPALSKYRKTLMT